MKLITNNAQAVYQEYINYADRYTAYVAALKARGSEDAEFIRIRSMPKIVLQQSDIFYIGSSKEMYLPEYIDDLEDFGLLNQNIPIFNNRHIIPIKDINNRVINLVGYRQNANERYMYATGQWYSRRKTLYGLENLHTMYEQGITLLTEGITDTQHLRGYGELSLATCGTYIDRHSIDVLNRLRYGVICIPDRDRAGMKALNGWRFKRRVVIYPNINYKDIDEMLRDGNVEVVLQAISEVKEYLKTRKVIGSNVEVTL